MKRRLPWIAALLIAACPILAPAPALAQANPRPVRVESGGEVTLPNGATIANQTPGPFVVDDEGERGGGRRVLILVANTDAAASEGVSCVFTNAVQRACLMPPGSRLVLFPTGAARPDLGAAAAAPAPVAAPPPAPAGDHPDPTHLDPGEGLALANEGAVYNQSDVRVVVDDEGEREGGRRVVIVGAVGVEGQEGAACRSITAEVLWECIVPPLGAAVVYAR